MSKELDQLERDVSEIIGGEPLPYATDAAAKWKAYEFFMLCGGALSCDEDEDKFVAGWRVWCGDYWDSAVVEHKDPTIALLRGIKAIKATK